MKKATLFRRGNRQIICTACRWYCRIPPGFVGLCAARANIDGALYLLVHSWGASWQIDPIEKKPLFHFLPGSSIFSLGTFGCNFGCEFCQNREISQTTKLLRAALIRKGKVKDVLAEISSYIEKNSQRLPPKEIVSYCRKRKIPAIAFTYNEPAIFAEYAADVMKLAKSYGMWGVFVSSGYESKEALDFLADFIDIYNVDLKGATDDFYQKLCHSRLQPVLDTITEIYRRKKWLEITTLLIPGYNTQEKDLRFIAHFIASLSPEIPWHVTAFYPHWRLLNVSTTPFNVLKRAWEIGHEEGLHFVYTGNIPQRETESTFCPQCGNLLIEREGFQVQLKNFDVKSGRCGSCGRHIAGIWQ